MAKETTSKAAAKTPEKKAAASKSVRPSAKKAAPAEKPDSASTTIAVKAPKAPVKAAKKPVATPAPEPKEKPKKPKLVRDSFTMPEAEYAVLGEVKKACLKAGIEVKKSELLRVGVALIRQLDTAKLKEILGGLPALKAGRPKKSK